MEKILSDSELMHLISQNNEEAFVEIFSRYASKVKGLMIKLGAKEQDAEEITQEVFVIIWKKANMYKEHKGAVSSWIFQISKNYRIDLLRKIKNINLDENDPLWVPDNKLNNDDILIEIEYKKEIEKAIQNLPNDTKNILISSFFEGLSHRELSEKFDKPLGTIKSKLRKAYNVMRLNLKKEDFI